MIRATPGDLYLDDLMKRVIAEGVKPDTWITLMVGSDAAEVFDRKLEDA